MTDVEKKGGVPHKPAGRGPQTWIAAALALAAVGAYGCKSDETRTLGPYGVAMSQNTTPALAGGEDNVYQVKTTVVLPLVPHDPQGPAVPPYTKALFYGSTEVELQLEYVITNVDDQPITAELLVDGFNEFWRYSPQVKLDDEGNVEADLSMVDRRVYIPAHSRVTGTVSYDDFQRMALGLAIMMNAPPNTVNPFHVVEPHTQLFTDQETAPYIPSLIDGLVGFDLSLRAITPAPPKLAVEGTLTILDHGSHLVPDGQTSDQQPPDFLYLPVVPVPPM